MIDPCKACGQTGLFVTRPVFDGFTKVGEVRVCATCGAEQDPAPGTPTAGEPGPRKNALFDQVFGGESVERIHVFQGDEHRRICGHCRHYLVNPFTQRCGLHMKEVQATDSCGSFEAKPDVSPS